MSGDHGRRCLIVERHGWEAAGGNDHLRIPAQAADAFFPWPQGQSEPISLRVYHPLTSPNPTSYAAARVFPKDPNGLRRIAGLPLAESSAPSFLFLEETEESRVYAFWWQEADLPAVFARYRERWNAGSNGQHPRLCAVVEAPVPRPVRPEPGEGDRLAPSFIKRVRIRGYKSIAFCDVSLAPLTLLVGRNASGKSNFLGALTLLHEMMGLGAQEAVKRHRGPQSILQRGSTSTTVSIGVDAEYKSLMAGLPYHASYDFQMALPRRQAPVVTSERVRIEDRNSGAVVGFDREGKEVTWVGLPDSSSPVRGWYSPDHLLLGLCGTSPFVELSVGFLNFGIYSIVPDFLREPQERLPALLLERSGKNLASVFDAIREANPAARDRIVQYLAAIVPGVEGVNVVSAADRDFLRFQVRPSTDGLPVEFDASSMSDGTLRALAWLTAASQGNLLQGAPSLVGIEEPETSLHPAALHALVDALDEATLNTQVLLTTHSADILDNPTIRPENVRVVQMIDGHTVIGPVDQAGVEIVARKLNTLGGLERENQLEPDLDDRDRQNRLAQNGREEQP